MLEIKMEVAAKVAEDVVEGIKAAVRGVVMSFAEVELFFSLSSCVKEAPSLWVHKKLEEEEEEEEIKRINSIR